VAAGAAELCGRAVFRQWRPAGDHRARGQRCPACEPAVAAGPGALLLRALAPGTREYLRASVDYDGIPVGAEDQFNLVLQRLRVPDSEWIEEQEILRRLSVLPGSERAVDRVLSASRLMRVAAHCRRSGRTPPGLCERVASSAMWRLAATVATGVEPSDYDLIGDAADRSGLFALRAGPRFELLCLPPLGATPMWASRLAGGGAAVSRPPGHAHRRSARQLGQSGGGPGGAARWPFHSANALLFLPRINAADRLRGRSELFAPCGAIAGFLSRCDGARDDAARPEAAGTQPDTLAAPELAARPAAAAVRTRRGAAPATAAARCQRLRGPAAGLAAMRGTRTLMPESAAPGATGDLPARRLSLWLQACILEGTRWTGLTSGRTRAVAAGAHAGRGFPGDRRGERRIRR